MSLYASTRLHFVKDSKMTRNSAYILMDVGGTFIKSGIMTAESVLVEGTQQSRKVHRYEHQGEAH